MEWSDIIGSKFLTTNHVGEDGKNLTIKRILRENIAGKNQDEREIKPVLYFEEEVPPMILNKTNTKRLQHFFPEVLSPNELKGEIINAYFDPTIEFAGKITGGLRIREKQSGED